MDNVTFGCNGPYGNAWKAEPLTYYQSTTSGVAVPALSLMSMKALFHLQKQRSLAVNRAETCSAIHRLTLYFPTPISVPSLFLRVSMLKLDVETYSKLQPAVYTGRYLQVVQPNTRSIVC